MNSNVPNPNNFVQHKIVDHQQQGIISATFEHPASWQAESNVYWNYQLTAVPAIFQARTVNPANYEIFEFLPMESFSWTMPEMGIYGRGQNVNGIINLPPMSGVDALAQLVIPKYRGNRQGLRIIEAHAEPAPVKPPVQISPQNVFGHKVTVKIEYAENGRMVEEEFRCLHTVIQFQPVNNGFGMTYFTGWSLTDLCCFRTIRGQFENVHQTFLKIQSSFHLNPQWVELNNQISQMLIQNAGRIGDQLIRNGWDRLQMNGQRIQETARINQDYINRQQDRINNSYNSPPPSSYSDSMFSGSKESEYGSHDAFIDSIREEQSIYNPENTANEKASIHNDYIWKDQFGHTQGTNDPNFDPNAGSDRYWTRAQKKRIGD